MLGINIERLSDLIKSFYNLTGIKVAIYNIRNEEIFAYPAENCRFCSLMQSGMENMCYLSTKELCDKCAASHGLTLHKCHAGLTEVAVPLTNGISVIGYVMFGQITNEKDRDKFMDEVGKRCTEYFEDCTEILEYAKEIPYFSDEHIKSVSDITNAIASYIIMS